MTEIMVILIMLVPVVLVVWMLNNSKKKQKKKASDRLTAYLESIELQEKIEPLFKKHLIHQVVCIDPRAGKLLVVNHQNQQLSYQLYPLNKIKNTKVANRKHTILPDDNNKKPEVITTHIGLEVNIEKPETELFLVLYDHVEHNIFQMAEFEKETKELKEIIDNAKIREMIA